MKDKILIFTAAVGVGVVAALLSGFIATRFGNPALANLGSASDNTLQTYPTVSQVFVKSTDTTVVASSTGRTYLSLDNASGATTTPQGVWCNFGDKAATLYSGFAIFPTSTKTFNLDNLYRGAIHCIAPASGALITITDF